MSEELKNTLKDIADELSNEESDTIKNLSIYFEDESKLTEIYTELKKAADIISKVADSIPSQPLTDEDFNNVDDLIEALATSGNEKMEKTASALEEILLTVGAKAVSNMKKAEDEELDRLKKKYKVSNDIYAVSELDKKIKEDYIKEYDKKVKTYKPLEASLSTRYSPNMPGVSLIRIDDDTYQCPITGEKFDYKSGFTTANGNKVPGTSVENQHQYDEISSGSMFLSTREQRLNDD